MWMWECFFLVPPHHIWLSVFVVVVVVQFVRAYRLRLARNCSMSNSLSLLSRIVPTFAALWLWSTMQLFSCSTSASFSPPMSMPSSSDSSTSASFVHASCDCLILCSISLFLSISTLWLSSSCASAIGAIGIAPAPTTAIVAIRIANFGDIIVIYSDLLSFIKDLELNHEFSYEFVFVIHMTEYTSVLCLGAWSALQPELNTSKKL